MGRIIEKVLARRLAYWLRQGGLRQLAAVFAPSLLWRADVDALFEEPHLPGTYKWEWTADWSVETMTEIVVRRIRCAPRPNDWCPFVLQIGFTSCEATLEAQRDNETPVRVRGFLETHAPSPDRSKTVYLDLLSEIYVAAMRQGGWTIEAGKLRAALK